MRQQEFIRWTSFSCYIQFSVKQWNLLVETIKHFGLVGKLRIGLQIFRTYIRSVSAIRFNVFT